MKDRPVCIYRLYKEEAEQHKANQRIRMLLGSTKDITRKEIPLFNEILHHKTFCYSQSQLSAAHISFSHFSQACDYQHSMYQSFNLNFHIL